MKWPAGWSGLCPTGRRPGPIFVLTNSEGCVHAINYQIRYPAFPLRDWS